jgi:hypothetical protein
MKHRAFGNAFLFSAFDRRRLASARPGRASSRVARMAPVW